MAKTFKGGPIALNSGGFGPDDYLIQPRRNARWIKVICRWGRNSTKNRNDYKADWEAWPKILQNTKRICVPDIARRYQKMKQRHQNILVINAAEFWTRYSK